MKTVTRQERNDYLSLCHRQPSDWLLACLADPSPGMVATVVATRVMRTVAELTKVAVKW